MLTLFLDAITLTWDGGGEMGLMRRVVSGMATLALAAAIAGVVVATGDAVERPEFHADGSRVVRNYDDLGLLLPELETDVPPIDSDWVRNYGRARPLAAPAPMMPKKVAFR